MAVPSAFSLNHDDLTTGIFEGVPETEVLGSTGRTVRVFSSPDQAFALGGFEVVLGEDFERSHRYDGFPRDEYMFFTKGGMRLSGDDGTVVEAGPGEMLFIPKGWSGIREITGDGMMQKFSVVYTPQD